METHRAAWKRFLSLDYIESAKARDFGLLLLRLAALPLFLHGWAKVGHYEGFVQFIGTTPVGSLAPGLFGFLVVAGEIVLGITLALGLFTRWSALANAILFAFIILLVNIPSNGLFSENGGFSFEGSLFYFVPALVLFFTGAGKFSLDHVLFGSDN